MAIVAITQHSFAQFSEDAIRFSQSQYGSTARIKGIGNAQTAIGGDLSSISGNPAGIGFFTKSEASLTPEFNATGIKSGYFGQSSNANSNNLNFNNASVVFYSKLNTPAGIDKGQGWLSANFGASFNRSSDFYQNTSYSGTNKNNSISNYYADLANSQGLDVNVYDRLQEMGANNFLVDAFWINPADHSKGQTYQSTVFGTFTGAPNKPVTQLANVMREGGQTSFDFSFGANYSNKLYLGAGIGITSIRYNMTNTFNESGIVSLADNAGNPYNANFNSTYSQTQATTGTGFNLRLGLIYKPLDAVRLGFQFTTPTWYTMQDDYSEGIKTAFTGGATGTTFDGPQDYQTTYSFHTPLKASAGLAIFLGKSGFITGDVEYIDYSSVNLSSGDGYGQSNADNDNHDIKTLTKSTANAHVGGELKLDQLYLRAGYGVQGNPYRYNGTNTNTISGGIGYRIIGGYYVDVTYANVKGSQLVAPYTVNAGNGPVASLDKTSNNVFLTVGMRF
jgi:hypothetical protein